MSGIVAMVCHFPPPVHGAAVVAQQVRERLERSGQNVLAIDTAPDSLQRGASYYLARIKKLWRMWSLFRLGREDVIYCSVNARGGVLIDLTAALIAGAIGARLVLHHHSFQYLEKSSLLHRMTFAANTGTHHIVLCERMKRKLVEAYGIETHNVHIFSNLNLVEVVSENMPAAAYDSMAVGFLSNITVEKGILDFVTITRRVSDIDVTFEIAGPTLDKVNDWIKDIETRSGGRARWIGPVNQVQKAKFLERIDVLLFPTRYRNEAEPLVIYEAMAAGVTVVAYDRGCIGEMVRPPHVIAANLDGMEQAIRSLFRNRPSRAEIRVQYVSQRAREERRLPILESA